MPELPEVETVRRALEPHLLGRSFTKIETFTETLRTPLRLAERPALLYSPITAVRRRAKYLLIELENLHLILVHLGMTGSFRVEDPKTDRRKHEHVVFWLSDGLTLRYEDPRRFGQAEVHMIKMPGGVPDDLPTLAPEPLSDGFDLAWLERVCKSRTRPIKNLIMDNALVVGVGNIYASESLFRAGIRPTTPAGELSKKRLARLHHEIRAVLQDAIDAGGTTIRDFATVDGSEGRFWRRLGIYGKAGELCKRCQRSHVKKLTMSGRSTYFCPTCQR